MTEGDMTNGTNYSELGHFMLRVADENKNVRGPYNACNYMEREARERNYDLGTDYKGEPRELPKGGAVSKYYRGVSFPEPWWIMAYADLFDLTPEQREELADHYAYRFRVVPARSAA